MFTFSGLSSRIIFRTQPATSMVSICLRDSTFRMRRPRLHAMLVRSGPMLAGSTPTIRPQPKSSSIRSFPRFNDDCRWNEAIERTGNKSVARNEGKLLGQTLVKLLLFRTPPSDLCVFKSVQLFEFNLLSGDRKIFVKFFSILRV